MEHLKRIRTSKQLLQKDVAKQLGIERTTYVKYETGVSEPSIDVLKKLQKIFGVSIDYMLTNNKEWKPDKYEDFINADNDYKKLMLIYEYGIPSNFPDVAVFYFEKENLLFSTVKSQNIEYNLSYAIRYLSSNQKLELCSYIKEKYKKCGNENIFNEHAILDKFYQLNNLNQAKVIGYIDSLIAQTNEIPREETYQVADSNKVSYKLVAKGGKVKETQPPIDEKTTL